MRWRWLHIGKAQLSPAGRMTQSGVFLTGRARQPSMYSPQAPFFSQPNDKQPRLRQWPRWVLACCVLACEATLAPLAMADEPVASLVNERSLGSEAALVLAQSALQACREQGFHVSLAVLDRHARALVAISDEAANPHTAENASRKAYTALTTRGPSGELGKRPPNALASFLQLANTTAAEGGLPIFAGQELVGAVGVSGAPGGDKDAACAQRGISRIASALKP